ncbi:MAG: hypothetical protein QOI59_2801 [Gammaproteobacteria bacterium]|jgi:hypothetical protein|nr:hypothetical protein [Gammaproteobacteria bacterium]
MSDRRFRTFGDFYPFYLGEHTHPVCRALHFAGTSLAAVLLAAALITQLWWLILAALVTGYAFAWVGHFFFEHNRPATFQYPMFSFLGDWRLWWDILTGKERMH